MTFFPSEVSSHHHINWIHQLPTMGNIDSNVSAAALKLSLPAQSTIKQKFEVEVEVL